MTAPLLSSLRRQVRGQGASGGEKTVLQGGESVECVQ